MLLPRPALMAIFNATPDSFSNAGVAVTAENAPALAQQAAAHGAALLDIGAESTRPGAAPVSEEEELRRLLPVLKAVRDACPAIPISVDTSKPAVAEASLRNGADFINDVTALEHPEMPAVIRRHRCSAVLMHNHPVPQEEDFTEALVRFFRERLDACAEKCGLPPEIFILDPGIGFNKSLQQNILCIKEIPALKRAFPDNPLLVGHSRKSFLGAITGRAVEEREAATVAGTALAALLGADILRVHDVAENQDAIRLATQLF